MRTTTMRVTCLAVAALLLLGNNIEIAQAETGRGGRGGYVQLRGGKRWQEKVVRGQDVQVVNGKTGPYYRKGRNFNKNGPLIFVEGYRRGKGDKRQYVHAHLKAKKTRKLFISFTSTLRAMAEGRITQKDLNRGLFYFGATKSYSLDPKSIEYQWAFGKNKKGALEASRQLASALKKAEKDGRSAFREAHERNTFEVLNTLLEGNGYTAIEKQPYYTYGGVADGLEKAETPLELIQ